MKYILRTLSTLFLFLSLLIAPYAQNDILAEIEIIMEFESDQQKVEKYDSLISLKLIENNLLVKGALYHELGKSHSSLENDEIAIEYFQRAIKVFSDYEKGHSELLNKSRYELSQLYKGLKRMNDQNILLHSIIEEGRKDIITCRSYADIGRNIAIKGDYHTALQYLNSVLADASISSNVDNELIIRDKIIYIYGLKYSSIFEEEDDNPDLNNILKHHVEVEKKIDKTSMPISKTYSMLNNLANVCSAYKGGLNTALIAYNKSLEFYKQINDTCEVHSLISNIGTVYSKLNDHKRANVCYQEVIDNSTDKDQRAAAYVNKGYFLNVESTKEKIQYYFIAFNILLDRSPTANESALLPTLEEIRSSNFESDFLEYLIDLASIFVQSYNESKDVLYLHRAKESIHLIDQLVSRIRYESLSEESTLYWIEKGIDTYMLGVEVCHMLHLPNEAFYFMEKNKALLLQENIKTLQAKWELDILDVTLEREYSLYYLRTDLYEKFLQSPDDSLIKKLYTQINKEYTVFMDSLDHIYPGYSKTKEQIQILSLDKIGDKYLSDDKCFIEYILNDKDGYGIFCTAQEKTLFKISDVKALQTDLAELKEYWTKPILNKTEISEFQNLGNSVFSRLFPFEGALEKLSGKQITIISDQKLNHLPFEALPVNIELDLVDSYFINFCEISYLQSISVSEQIRQKINNPEFSLLGLVPYEFQVDELPTLSKSKKAIEVLSDYKNSKILIESDATKENFLKEINKYEVIHLNTHAGIDAYSLEPWIAFRNKKMSLNELYGKENQAELVVLDACKTNDGKLLSGEGILNLSRGFFYNGTQSVLASNWNVNEKSGNQIIKKFYTELQKGNTKSKALQLAKIDYLKENQYAQSLPYFWAAFTLMGDISPVDLSSNTSYQLGILGLILLSLVLFLFFRKR